jgi:hypothetical protein
LEAAPQAARQTESTLQVRDDAFDPSAKVAQFAVDAAGLDHVLDLESATLAEGHIFDSQALDVRQVGLRSEAPIEGGLPRGSTE